MGIDFNDAEGIEPELLEKAKKGEATMKNTASTDAESLNISGGSGGGNLPFDEVLEQSQNNLTKVKQIISQGGFTGPEKDKYDLSLHHAEWVHSRNIEHKCDNEVKEKSVKYTALVNGKAQTHEINKAHSDWKSMREKCKNSSSDLFNKATQYIETDRRVRANKKAESEIYPSFSSNQEKFQVARSDNNDTINVEGFIGTNPLKEGFDYYNGTSFADGNKVIPESNPSARKFNERLPLYDDKNRNTAFEPSTTILPWKEYYVDCSIQSESSRSQLCDIANRRKNQYIMTINQLFDKSDELLNSYYTLSKIGSGTKDNAKINEILMKNSNIKSIVDNQKKNIALYKQNALYDYDEYNSLSFYEDLIIFIYYALFAIFVFMSLREFFSSSGGSYDKRNIIILILLGIYPKYILQVVLWLINAVEKIIEMLGVKNVRFWSA
jgi:hypothetical protein